jgi:hypothetical protein
MEIQHFFDPVTSTLTYVVHDTKNGVVIDPVLLTIPRALVRLSSPRRPWRNISLARILQSPT